MATAAVARGSVQVRSNKRLQQAAAAVVDYEVAPAHTRQKTFLVWCPLATTDGVLTAVVHAFYYLPQNFRLMLPGVLTHSAVISGAMSRQLIMGRVQFYDVEGSLWRGPSLLADAVVAGKPQKKLSSLPQVVVAVDHAGLQAQGKDFVVEHSPEAIASALLRLSRAKAP